MTVTKLLHRWQSAGSHATPPALYARLDREFRFTLDPCKLEPTMEGGGGLFGPDGLLIPWRGERVFCNPPFRAISPWVDRADEPEIAVFLLPVSSDTRWWRMLLAGATEIRFVRGRLTFAGQTTPAPFPSCVVVFGCKGGPWAPSGDCPRVCSMDLSREERGLAP